MIDVEIQMWGPIENSGCSYHWITVGKVETLSPKAEDLRKQAVEIFNQAPIKPNTPLARFVFYKDGTRYMDLVFEDVYRGILKSNTTK